MLVPSQRSTFPPAGPRLRWDWVHAAPWLLLYGDEPSWSKPTGSIGPCRMAPYALLWVLGQPPRQRSRRRLEGVQSAATQPSIQWSELRSLSAQPRWPPDPGLKRSGPSD